jgi:hypothetical protein
MDQYRNSKSPRFVIKKKFITIEYSHFSTLDQNIFLIIEDVINSQILFSRLNNGTSTSVNMTEIKWRRALEKFHSGFHRHGMQWLFYGRGKLCVTLLIFRHLYPLFQTEYKVTRKNVGFGFIFCCSSSGLFVDINKATQKLLLKYLNIVL